MLNKIKYTMGDLANGGREGEFTISKFKAMDSLDFIIDLINYLPETISLPNEISIKKETMRYIIFMLMDVGIDAKITDDQKASLNDFMQLDLIDVIFREAYSNASLQTRQHIRTQLISLLSMEGGHPVNDDLDIFIKSPKSIFNAFRMIVKYNYNDFFLVTEGKSL